MGEGEPKHRAAGGFAERKEAFAAEESRKQKVGAVTNSKLANIAKRTYECRWAVKVDVRPENKSEHCPQAVTPHTRVRAVPTFILRPCIEHYTPG